MDYKPLPIDVSRAALPEALLKLAESLAANAHDVWALGRLREGWTYDPVHDQAKRTHPGLASYGELPEQEKAYGRRTAEATLKAILALGYRIEAPEQGPRTGQARDLTPLDACRSRGEKLRKSGDPLLAYNEIQKGLKVWPADLRLRQLLALALADSGAASRAEEIAARLRQEGHEDEETLGIMARAGKDLWRQASDPVQKDQRLRAAHAAYARSFALTGGYYSAINAATLALLLGREEEARSLARAARATCLEKLTRPEGRVETYYLQATLGEAALILHETGEAKERYAAAAEAGLGQYRDIQSTRRNARLILAHRGQDESSILASLRIPAVAVFTGHMIDRPERAAQRFPDSPELEATVARALRQRIADRGIGFGFASAAAGGDILFLEALRETGKEAHVVLPYNREHFLEDCVGYLPGTAWRQRCEAILDRLEAAGRVSLASDWRIGSGEASYDFANRLLYGLATLRCRQLDAELVPMALWDGEDNHAQGGTSWTTAWWESKGHRVERVDLAALKAKTGPSLASPEGKEIAPAQGAALEALPAPRIMAIFFADVVGYSKLTEEQTPRFVEHLMGGAAARLARLPRQPAAKNTWGDALYFVFEHVREAGLLALDLAEFMAATTWEDLGLPASLNLRIALHAGPVLAIRDPITGLNTFTGAHVSRAARIEPITPPGQVYASEAFSALAAAEGITDFACDYVGAIEYAKRFGTYPAYHVRRVAAGAPPGDSHENGAGRGRGLVWRS